MKWNFFCRYGWGNFFHMMLYWCYICQKFYKAHTDSRGRKSSVSLGFILHHTGSLTVHSDIIVAFYNPPNVSLPEPAETGSRSGCCRVVLRCSVIAPSCLGRGYFWLPPCLNPVVILQRIIRASSLSSPQPLPAHPTFLPSHPTSSRSHLVSPSSFLHIPSSWASSFNTTAGLPRYIFVPSSCLRAPGLPGCGPITCIIYTFIRLYNISAVSPHTLQIYKEIYD